VERNPKLRESAIQIHGRNCCVCGFNFDEVFGKDLAQGYIEVHHLNNIASGERITDPATDLAPLCANCHAMADRLTAKPHISAEEHCSFEGTSISVIPPASNWAITR
jgi:predicted HNH restriction endonuclease